MNRREAIAATAIGPLSVLTGPLLMERTPAPRIWFEDGFVVIRFESPPEQIVRAIQNDHLTTNNGWVCYRQTSNWTRGKGHTYVEVGICSIETAREREEQIFGWDHIARKLRPSVWSWLQ